MDHDQRHDQLENDVVELLHINQELVQSLTLVVMRLESIPDAKSMDPMRATIMHMNNRLHDVLTHYNGPP